MWPGIRVHFRAIGLINLRDVGVSGGRVQWIAAGNELEFSILSSLLEVSESSAPDRVHQLVPFISSVLALGSNSTLRCIFVMRILNSCIQNDATHAHAGETLNVKLTLRCSLDFIPRHENASNSSIDLCVSLGMRIGEHAGASTDFEVCSRSIP